MKNSTRELYNALLIAMSSGYGIADVTKAFAVDIPMETKLNDAIQQSSAFLQMITMTGVTDSKGQALELGVSGLLAKRTNINDKDRQPKVMGGPTGTNWETKFTEFDVAIGYALLDQWARYPDFAQRYMKAVYRAIALDRMTIGWYGQSAAVESDGSTYTLGEDVNIGWLKLLETQNSGNLMTQGAAVGEITIGSKAGNDYANLDAMVYDLLSGIPVEHRTGNEVAIVGSALVADDMNKALSKNGHTPSEKGLGITNLANSYGGLSSVQVPRFPDTGVVVTDPSNLHLYFQESGTRRNTEEESKRNRVVDYISSNDAYALGNKNAITAVKAENVKIVNG